MSRNTPRPLRPIQRQAAEYLAKGFTATRAAREIGVRRETVCRWKSDARFTALVTLYRDEMHEVAMQRMPELFDAAVLTLSDQLRTGTNPTWAALGVLRLFGVERLLHVPADAPACITVEACTKP